MINHFNISPILVLTTRQYGEPAPP